MRRQHLRYHAPAIIANVAACIVVAYVCQIWLALVLIVSTFVGLAVCEWRVVHAYRAGYFMALHTTARSIVEDENLLPPSPRDVHPADAQNFLRTIKEVRRDHSE